MTTESQLDLAGEAIDESLAASARAGDDAAFEQLFLRHRARIARLAGRFLNRPDKVEEIVQEVFAKTYFALADYSARSNASFAAWLSRIAVNACYDEMRRARRRPESSLNDFTDEEVAWLSQQLRAEAGAADIESAVISRDLADKLLAQLKADDRLVLTLLDGEGLPVADIAALTGWTVSKVKVRAHRARSALRRVLGQFA